MLWTYVLLDSGCAARLLACLFFLRSGPLPFFASGLAARPGLMNCDTASPSGPWNCASISLASSSTRTSVTLLFEGRRRRLWWLWNTAWRCERQGN